MVMNECVQPRKLDHQQHSLDLLSIVAAAATIFGVHGGTS